MANIDVIFMHPTNMGTIDVEVDDQMTGKEAIEGLLENDFIPQSSEGYKLAIKGGNEIPLSGTLLSAGVKAGNTLRIIPTTNAGFLPLTINDLL